MTDDASPTPFSLADKVALVTGAGRGLGLEIAKAFAATGAHVVLNGRDPSALEAAASVIADDGGAASTEPFDITDSDAASGAIARIAETNGRLDILVNNVGLRDRRGLFDFALDDVTALLDANLVAPFHLAREAARPMIDGGYGRIINITSIAGPLAGPGDAVYTAAKGGLEALTRALAAELGGHGITANAIAPGFFATEANAEKVADPAIAGWLKHRTALGRWAEPHEIAGAAVFLASAEASYVTGHMLAVDGGYLIHF